MAPIAVSLHGKVALVTGANTGIGLVTARELARAGAKVWIACRSQAKAEAAMADIRQQVPTANLAFLRLDLGSLAATRQAAETFLASGDALHLLINNAGLAGFQGSTTEGFEIQFGTNHLGPYLFTRLLLERIKASDSARIVNVASRGHYRSKGIPFDHLQKPTRTVVAFDEYCDSKLANVLFTKALTKRLPGDRVTTYCLHPGVVASEIWRRVPQPFRWIAMQFMLTNEQGALTTLHCAASPDAAKETGLYYDVQKPKTPSKLARDEALADELWNKSAEWTGLQP
ncbi:MAG: SDR family oxidoreductase [Myxococcales bacterium]|nr:SDR family oxidoreductase [Myxococcales bacterium]